MNHKKVVGIVNSGEPEEIQVNHEYTKRHEQLAGLGVTGKALAILETVVNSPKPTPISEIIRETGLTKPTAHRVINLLAEIGFVERDMSGLGLIEGKSLVNLAHQTLAAAAPRTIRNSILRRLSEEVGETCNYGVLSGGEVVYLDRVEAKWPLGLRFNPGSRVPSHCTSIGKLLLGKLSDVNLKRIISSLVLTPYTDNSITDPSLLLEAIQDVRKDEIGTDNQEFMYGVVCVAVPILSRKGRCLGGVAISAPEARMTLNEILGFTPRMREAAQDIAATYQVD
jgi:DNA-binding IclR family transcriptional regulator